MSRLWLTGYRSYELEIFQDKDPKLAVIKRAVDQMLREQIEQGVDWIITGPQLGVEQWGARWSLALKKDYPEIQVAVMAPFAEFGSQWNDDNRGKLSQLMADVDFSDQVSDTPYRSPAQLKNYQTFMLTHTDAALFVYDPEFPGKTDYELTAARQFAESHPYPIYFIDFDQLQEMANEMQEEQNEAEMERNGEDS